MADSSPRFHVSKKNVCRKYTVRQSQAMCTYPDPQLCPMQHEIFRFRCDVFLAAETEMRFLPCFHRSPPPRQRTSYLVLDILRQLLRHCPGRENVHRWPGGAEILMEPVSAIVIGSTSSACKASLFENAVDVALHASGSISSPLDSFDDIVPMA